MARNEAVAELEESLEMTEEDVIRMVGALNGTQKTAIMLISLGVQVAGKVLRNMRDEEVERISIEMALQRNIPPQVVEAVMLEFRDMQMAKEYITQGGLMFARDALEQSVGHSRAEEILMKIEAAMQVSAFHLLQTVETGMLINFLQNEHPQTSALILSNLNPRKSAEIITGLEATLQNEIMYRLATMGKTSPELLRDIEEVIRDQIGSVLGTELSATGGIESVAEILNNISRNTEKTIMDGLAERDPNLAVSIKNLMFVFDDLVNISDRDLQRILVEVDQKDLVMSLKGASPDLADKMLANLSERAAAMVKEEMELMGPVKVRDVEESQRAILNAAQTLDEQEEIQLSSTLEDTL